MMEFIWYCPETDEILLLELELHGKFLRDPFVFSMATLTTRAYFFIGEL